MKREKEYGEINKYDAIRQILRDQGSRENPIGLSKIKEELHKIGCNIGRTAIEGFMNELAAPYETEEECDEILCNWSLDNHEIILCKISEGGRRTRGYWMQETLSDSEWMYLMDSVLYSKILTKKEADNLAKRITVLAGKNFSDLTKYRHRMAAQLYFVGEADINEQIGHIESRVLKQMHLIRRAINDGKKVKFTLNVYKYGDQEVKLAPYGKFERICSPFDIVYSNGRYYMLGADLETERRKDLKYKLYRVDLMTDLSITRAVAVTKEEAGIDLSDLYKYRIENPYMFTGDVESVRIRVEADQFTQIVDWFSDNFKVFGHDANDNTCYDIDADDNTYYDIDVRVNTNSFIYWVLQYSGRGCVEVLEAGKKRKGDKGAESFRNKVKNALRDALRKYED